MEPTKNLSTDMGGINNMGNANIQPQDPVFRGMPKPGQPLASTPRVDASTQGAFGSAPRPVSAPSSQMASSTSSTFSAHSPSALDRLMNPSLAQNIPQSAPISSQSSVSPSPSVPLSSQPKPTPSYSAPTPASASVFKPYTPPAKPVSSPIPSSVPTQNFAQTASSVAPAASSTGQSFGSYSSNTYASGIPAAPSANITAAKLGSEVNAILNSQQKAPKSHRGTILLTVSLIVVLLLLAGGGYYWYTNMYLPNKESETSTLQNTQENFGNQTNTTNVNNTRSAFPTAVTKPVVNTQPVATSTSVKPAPAKAPSKPTRITTPFTQTQRDQVSSYIIANINTIAPRTGGSYEVTDVTFDGPDRAVVQYTNGRNSYTAVAVASIDTAGNIRIVSFSPLEK